MQVAGNYRVDLAEAVRDAALAGLGIAYVANYLLDKELQSGQLIPLLPQWQPEPEDGGARRLCQARASGPQDPPLHRLPQGVLRPRALLGAAAGPGSGQLSGLEE